ncbi:MAG TPA: GH92 family glycosyl hydrolase [Acidobacteriaceae bacterium]|nr:GH92 family glycosyl hydrolase [Acidobacteriaceae bacterium]
MTFSNSHRRLRRSLGTCFFLAVTLPVLAASAQEHATNLARYVDPYIGVDWGGNTFIGAAVPFGMVKLGPDMESFDHRPSGFGYSSDGAILGFSHTHLSGAQGKYGNILVQPVTGTVTLGQLSSPRNAESASPGYYAATLTRYGVRAEVSSTRHTGVHRYTFPASKDAHLTIDIEHCLSRGNRKGWEDQHFDGGEVHIVSPREVAGVGRYSGGWNRGGEYSVYFDLVTDAPVRASRTWTGSSITAAKDASVSTEIPLGAILDFSTTAGQPVHVKVGISFISIDRARANLAAEMPAFDLDATRRNALQQWEKQLQTIHLQGATPSQMRQIYTAVYHTMLMPVDRTHENPLWQSSEPYYDDYYAIWDTFRTSAPLLTLIAPDRERDLVRSLLDIYRHEGYMPDARSGNDTGRTQGGSNTDVMVADAFVKHLPGIDYKLALQAMMKNAEVPPQDPQKEGRGGLADYNRLGYVTTADERAGSRTVEYANDDFSIAEVACGLGEQDIATKYLARAHNFENLWDPKLIEGADVNQRAKRSVPGFSGFIRPRNPDGSWAAPNTIVRGSWWTFFYEGDEWTYSLYAPQDTARIVELAGGPSEFTRRLDYIFTHGHYDVSNEPGFMLPMLYLWARRPDRTADVLRLTLEKNFTDTRAGIPGNDDSGAMSSWLIFNTLGFYPVAGQDVYLIGSPAVPQSTISVGHGKRLRIVAHGAGADGLNRYIQSATLNGKPWEKAWFRHADIANGGELELQMGSALSEWGTKISPPSASDRGFQLCKR